MIIVPGRYNFQPNRNLTVDRRSAANNRISTLIPFGNANYDLVTGKLLSFGSAASIVPDTRGLSLKSAGSASCASIAINLSMYTKLSISFWLYWDAYADDDKLCMEYGANYITNSGFLIDPNSSSAAGKFETGIGSSGQYNNWSMARPSAAAWHHYAITIDRTLGTAQSIYAWVDGVSQSMSSLGTLGNPADSFGNNSLYLFSRNNSSLYGAGRIQNLVIRGQYLLKTPEVLEEYNNPWGLFKGPESDILYNVVSYDLSGSASSAATATGAITIEMPIAGAATSVASATGAINQSIDLAGSAASATIANGAIDLSITLSGDSFAQAAATGQIDLSIALEGSALAEAIASANLDPGEGFQGDAIGSASASGQLSIDVPLSGAASASASGTGNIAAIMPITGAAISVADASGDLTVEIGFNLSGNALAQTLAAGEINISIPLSGSALARSIATASLTDSAMVGAIGTERIYLSMLSNRIALMMPSNKIALGK